MNMSESIETPRPQQSADVLNEENGDNVCNAGAGYETTYIPEYDVRYNVQLREIYNAVIATGTYNYNHARARVPSGLCLSAWREYLADYSDRQIVEYLEYGWPVNYRRGSPLVSTHDNHASARDHAEDVAFYVATELGHRALAGPFKGPPVSGLHMSPLMTRPKRDSSHRRVIMDLSWPHGASINDGVEADIYIDGPARIHLPTADYMVDRILQLGSGAYLYKTDLSRGYRQLRVDPGDWPLLGFQHDGSIYMDICPPFGLQTSAMFMQRTSEAITHIHAKKGYFSRPYLDDFSGAEGTHARADEALGCLQSIMRELGIAEAEHKVCPPAQSMIWLGIQYDTVTMEMSIPPQKLREIGEVVSGWQGRSRATQREMQSLFGLLQFVASVSPPARLFTNRILENLRETPRRGSESLSLGFRQDLKFFADLLPHYNGVRIMQKREVLCQEALELDACLRGCGAFTGEQFYSEVFPLAVLREERTIAQLELLNIVVAIKVWAPEWSGQRVRVFCDNTNAVLAAQTGRSRDPYVQQCVRELFQWCTRYDVELHVTHRAGTLMAKADPLSRADTGEKLQKVLEADLELAQATQVRVPVEYFELLNML